MKTILTFTRHNGRDEDDTEHQTMHNQGVTIEIGGEGMLPTIIDVAARSVVARWSANSGRWQVKAPWLDLGLMHSRFDQIFIQAAPIEDLLAELDLHDGTGHPRDEGYQEALNDVRMKFGLPVPKGED